MFPALSPLARLSAAVLALVALASLGLRLVSSMEELSIGAPEAAWRMARFFTILTNALVVITFAIAAFRRSGIGGAWVAALTLSIMLAGGVYYAILAAGNDFEGIARIADIGMHSVVPLGCLAWWLIFAPKRQLIYADLPMFILWPCVYVAYALGRGSADGTYPYSFMNVTELGIAAVITNLVGLLLILLLGGVFFVMIGRFTDR